MSVLTPNPNQQVIPSLILVPDGMGRIWTDPIHIEAGYPTMIFGAIPTAQSKLIGKHTFPSGNTVVVEYLDKGPSGNPELRLEWPDGSAVTVIDEATAQAYLSLEK
jgi:hypothetical protein